MTGHATAPRPLVPGDRVAVVAPSGPIDPVRLARGVATLESWGLFVDVMPNAYARSDNGMYAGADSNRASDLEQAWCRPDVKAVLCARGGYGASRIIDLVNWDRMMDPPSKWFVGSSDVTALHEALRRRLGVGTLYGPMVASEIFAGATPDAATVEGLRSVLFDGVDGLVLKADEPRIAIEGSAGGPLVGGNLAVVASGIGTPDSIGAAGSVAFLEDVNEPPYKVDRMLTQLLRSGWFTGVRGVALGTFQGCGEVLPVLVERLSPQKVPVLGTFAVGHGPRQLSVPLGAEVELHTGSGTLTVRHSVA